MTVYGGAAIVANGKNEKRTDFYFGNRYTSLNSFLADDSSSILLFVDRYTICISTPIVPING